MNASSSRSLIACSLLVCCIAASVAAHEDADHTTLYPVYRDGAWGYANAAGEVVIPPSYDVAHDFHEGRTGVVRWEKGDKPRVAGYIREDGTLICNQEGGYPTRDFSEGRAWFHSGDYVGCIDADGNIVIPPDTYHRAVDYSEGLAVVAIYAPERVNDPFGEGVDHWGFVDLEGNVAIPLEFGYLGSFDSGRAFACDASDSGNWRYIDHEGKVVFWLDDLVLRPTQHPSAAADFSAGRLALYLDGSSPSDRECILLDVDGNPLGTYPGLRSYSEGLAAFKDSSGKFGFIDLEQNVVISPRFDNAHEFHEGLAMIEIGTGHILNGNLEFAFINRHGEIVLQGENLQGAWNDAEEFNGELARVHVGGRMEDYNHGCNWVDGNWHYINRQGEIVMLCRPDHTRVDEHRPFGHESPVTE